MSELKTKYKWIHFVKIETRPKTDIWECREESGAWLARIGWYSSWRQYCVLGFNPAGVFHDGCLKDIADFLGQLNRAHKAKGQV